jgi:ankyrin repeat protein
MRLALTTDETQLASFLSTLSSPDLLFAQDYKGRTALDWARMKNNSRAIALISEAMARELNQARMTQSGAVSLSSEFHLVETNKHFTRQVFSLLKKPLPPATSQSPTMTQPLPSQPPTSSEPQSEPLIHSQLSQQQKIMDLLLSSQLSRDAIASLPNEIYFVDSTFPSTGDTPLLLAAGAGLYDVVMELLAMGADINQANKYGHNPLTWSAVCGQTEIVRLLLVKNADFQFVTKSEQRTCLHYACLYLKARVVSVIMDVLFEKFSLFRTISHPFTKYDPWRWRKYAELLESFLMVC